MNNTKLFVILCNQLFNPVYIDRIKEFDFYMSEDFGLCSYVKHHKFKILQTLSAMRSYRDELKKIGLKVTYLSIEDDSFYQEYFSKLKIFLENNKYKEVYFFDIEDKFFEDKLKKINLNVKIQIIKSPMFLYDRSELKILFNNKKKPLMANFYKHSRKKHNILIDNDAPTGGKWSFDEENRKKLPKDIKIPNMPKIEKTKHTLELIPIVNKIFKDNVGDLNEFWLPTNRNSCNKFFENFLNKKFFLFGDYEDAINTNDDFLFHSALSPIVNIGLLTPKEILKKLDYYADKININSYEGFIRQIIGWREFIRAMYQAFDKKFLTGNYFNNKRKMNESWYNASTGLLPLDDAISKAIKLGWNHHIERLMIICNIMNLSEINPNEVYNWFMEFYVDSSDWVMVPNVYGMGLFSDGGIFSTKPYICASSYILKMSNYKKGPWSDILDGLYWKFIDNNRDKLRINPRIGIMTKMVDNMEKNRKNKIYAAADKFLNIHTS